ncbi:aminotransferase class I/II-fold pyridoxal phosphate-dependent enzyme, partial [Escherichia coli]|nr:aminotransferase class I/II-fold pyridoxal phosphate-dependent enzyme [Escherichia coli]
RLPYHLSAVTQATAIAALKNVDALLAEVEQIKTQRDRIVTRLTELGLQPSVSDSNFVFFGGLQDPEAIWQGLLEAGIIVRNNGIPGTLRVTAGT